MPCSAYGIRSKGIKLLVIGIGAGVDQAELLKLGDNEKENVFFAIIALI